MSSERQRAKTTAWKWFSKYIRLRDCMKTTGTQTHCLCITCGSRQPFEKIHAGHFIDGRGNAVLFDESLVYGQCNKCNTYLHGNHGKYMLKMIDTYGREWVDEKLKLRHQVKKMTVQDIRDISDKFREKYNGLMKGGVDYLKK